MSQAADYRTVRIEYEPGQIGLCEHAIYLQAARQARLIAQAWPDRREIQLGFARFWIGIARTARICERIEGRRLP